MRFLCNIYVAAGIVFPETVLALLGYQLRLRAGGGDAGNVHSGWDPGLGSQFIFSRGPLPGRLAEVV